MRIAATLLPNLHTATDCMSITYVIYRQRHAYRSHAAPNLHTATDCKEALITDNKLTHLLQILSCEGITLCSGLTTTELTDLKRSTRE